MSITLDNGTTPAGLLVKTWGHSVDGCQVHIGAYELSLDDFLATAMYVLTNSDLEPGDLRRDFVGAVTSLQEVPGFAPNRTRLGP